MDEILEAFVEDGQDHLDAMESGLLQLEEGSHSPDTLNAIFRAAHTIKGDAGVVGLEHVQRFAHMLEDYFDQLRKNSLAITPSLVTHLLQGCDHIKQMFACLLAGNFEPDPALEEAGLRLKHALCALTGAADAPPAALAPGILIRMQDLLPEDTLQPKEAERFTAAVLLSDCWHITVRFGRDMFRYGMDPRDFLMYLGNQGEIVQIAPLTDEFPPLAELDPEACYLGFDLYFRTDASLADIEEAFALAGQDCRLDIAPPGGAPFVAGLDPRITAGETAESLLATDAVEPAPTFSVPLQTELQAGELQLHVDKAPPKPAGSKKKKADEQRAIRVQAEKLDQLIDLVGEIVVSSAGAKHLAKKSRRSDLIVANTSLARLVERMREISLGLRMVEIGDTFNRFKRAVRDMARELNREVELVIHGADTELDKSVVEKIGDPLMHLVRNAIDHGLEAAEVRLAQGKPAIGRIELNAYHEAGGIVIEVADDGKGLDKARILQKAIERGLVQDGQVLSNTEICDLIFLPGFSTAEKITNISGRGVGMDVVRSNIAALRGSIEVHTEKGQGSRFVIRLPLTMAIIDGFQVAVGKGTYVIPLETVMECTRFRPTGSGRDYVNLRGEVLPTINMRQFFNVGGTPPARENVVVVQSGKLRAGLIVDKLLGELQTVIKPLSSMFQTAPGITGSTILASGEVALILDIPTLVKRARDSEERFIADRKEPPRPPLAG